MIQRTQTLEATFRHWKNGFATGAADCGARSETVTSRSAAAEFSRMQMNLARMPFEPRQRCRNFAPPLKRDESSKQAEFAESVLSIQLFSKLRNFGVGQLLDFFSVKWKRKACQLTSKYFQVTWI
jgi:hypothetical protein